MVPTDPSGEVALTVLPLTLHMHALDLALPLGMGALWRSAWGRALQSVDRAAFEAFFGEGGHGRLVALRPPLTPVRPGQAFEWRLTLFGPAIAHAPAVVASVRQLAHIGVGQERRRALLLEVGDAEGPCWQFDHGWLRQVRAIDGARWWACPPELTDAEAAHAVTVECLTPVALKQDNGWLHEPPPWAVWVRRALGRTAQLAQAAGQANPIGRSRADAWLSQCDGVACEQAQMRLMRLQRQSARSGQRMTVPTQLGSFTYAPVPGSLWPLLKWMELVQVGAKTAFGCGVVRLRSQPWSGGRAAQGGRVAGGRADRKGYAKDAKMAQTH